MLETGTLDLDTLLLAAILVALILQIWLTLRGSGGRDLARHNDRLARALDAPGLARDLERSILLEAALAAQIEAGFERFREMPREELEAALATAGYRTTEEQVIERIKGFFTRERAGAFGEKLFEKLLGLFNKTIGLG